ncbi:MAG: type II toxin-antitoxin system VapC family toxin [Candidatus Hodarchaeales archaeon]
MAWTNSFIVFSMVLTIQHKMKSITKAQKLISILRSYSGLKIFYLNPNTIFRALNEQKSNNLDFDDSLVIASMKELRIVDLITFDNHFNNITSIKKITPSEALSKFFRR